jgi:hypothetical protein
VDQNSDPPNVQTGNGKRSLRHTDLYVIAAGQIISLEYKYAGPKGLSSPDECAAQKGPYTSPPRPLHGLSFTRVLRVEHRCVAGIR